MSQSPKEVNKKNKVSRFFEKLFSSDKPAEVEEKKAYMTESAQSMVIAD